MDKNIKSGGREKHVTSGKGGVYKRGDGLNSKKPAGGGYSGRGPSRPSSSSSGQSSQGGGLFGGSSSGSGRTSGGLNFKRILIIIAVIVVAFILIRACTGSSLLDSIDTSTFDSSGIISDTTTSGGSSTLSNNAVLDTTVSAEARAKRTAILGEGDDTVTIMIYMCGTDLESRSGMATADLNEILHADISDKVNIIVETGGTKTWQNNVISNQTNQRYQCTSEGLKLLEDKLGRRTMTEPETLTDFVQYCEAEFPANRYGLILWDHGGGSAQGYGYDEFTPTTTMTLDEIDDALDAADCTFDFVGFDACLMATYETAMMLDRYSDYMIASEETEPGIGWYYTDWISALSADTSMSTPEIGQHIIDSFVEKCYQNSRADKATLSVIDLAEFSGTVPDKFSAFAVSTAGLISSDDYQTVSDARSGTREFGSPSQLDQIDLIHLAQNMDTAEAQALIQVLDGSIKYNRTSSTITNANGVSIYFPFDKLSTLGPMLTTYDEIGMDDAYSDCIRAFANLEAGGQIASSGSDSPMGSLLGSLTGGSSSGGSGIGMELIGSLLGSFLSNGDFSSILGEQTADSTNWLDSDALNDAAPYIEENYLNSDDLSLTQKDGGYVLSLTDEQWDLIQTLNLNVFVDDGEGYIDLGMDNVYEFDDDGDLMMDYDGTWLALNGQVVSYYFISEDRTDNGYTISGYVPAMLNDQRVNLMLVFTDENPYGEVLGARIIYDDAKDTVPKGLIEIEAGDTLDFICDYYTYDETFDDSYYLDDPMVVEGTLAVSNVSIGDLPALVTYRMTDIYNNTYWTPALYSEAN